MQGRRPVAEPDGAVDNGAAEAGGLGFRRGGVGLARLATYDRGNITTYSANYSIRIGDRGALTLSASRAVGASSGTSFGATLTMPLGNQINSSTSFSSRPGLTDGYSSVSKGLTSETGVGSRQVRLRPSALAR